MLTVREAAKLLRINPKTLYSEIQKGSVPAVRFGRVIRIPSRVVLSLAEQGRVVPSGGIHGGST